MVRNLLIGLLLAATSCLYGQSTSATQTVHIRVLPVASLAVVGEPTLTVQPADAGDLVLQAEDRSSRYRLSSNRPSLKLSASMSESLPDGMRLLMKVASQRGTSLGSIDLSSGSGPSTVVDGITRGADFDQEIAYTLLVDATKVGPTSSTRTIVLTLTE